MTVKKNEVLRLQVTKGLQVTVLPSKYHEFLMPTKDVAAGFGINANTLRSHKRHNIDELKENRHFINGVQYLHATGINRATTMWTKAGVIRLGFFIKTERAKMFRDWVEGLVLNYVEKKLPALPEVPKRKHNRLTSERLLDIMADVVKIENSDLRISISKKILGG